MSKEISDGRKLGYYIGMAIGAVGFLLFISVFFTSALNFGNFDNFEARGRSTALRAVSGMVLMIVGAGISSIGARGMAGSGVILNPSRAREDLRPYSNMAGGMLGDVLESANISEHLGGQRGDGEPIVMIKCMKCGKLNEEDSKFCQECGASFEPTG